MNCIVLLFNAEIFIGGGVSVSEPNLALFLNKKYFCMFVPCVISVVPLKHSSANN